MIDSNFVLDKENPKDSKKEEDSSKEVEEENFDLDSPLSALFDETGDLDLLTDMMIQSSAPHFQHPRQPQNQNYVGHSMNAYRQSSYHAAQVILCNKS